MARQISRVAVAQITSTSDVQRNLLRCVELIAEAAQGKAQAVFFPEASDYIADGKEQSLALSQPLSGPFVSGIRAAAQQHSIWVSIGVHQSIVDSTDSRFFNTHVLIDGEGQLVATYNKVHLFNVNIVNGPNLRESDVVIPGSDLGKPIQTPFGMVGLQICYDLRFPAQAQHQRALGATVLTYPSAFTVPTGQAHWETLLRARAIENQSFVIAAAQVGKHNAKRESFGNAMVINPWGVILAHCREPIECIAFADLDWSVLDQTRREMPVFDHRRLDLYPKPIDSQL